MKEKWNRRKKGKKKGNRDGMKEKGNLWGMGKRLRGINGWRIN
jgi:hypothetical protein